MAKKQAPVVDTSGVEVVEELHAPLVGESNEVEFEDVTGKDELPPGVSSVDDAEDTPPAKPVKGEKPSKAAAAKKPAVVEDEIPEELKGKTSVQLAKMYREAQSALGRQGSEVGELRRMVDGYIKQRLAEDAKGKKSGEKAEDAEKDPDTVDFFTDPAKAISKIIENHPALKQLNKADQEFAAREMQRQREQATVQFQQDYPDAGDVLADPKFREWVAGSPIRKSLLLRAHQHYDLSAANEIFGTWKALQGVRVPAEADTGVAAPKPAAGKESARVPTGGNASPRGDGKSPKKFYRRADIIKMMIDEPDRYQMLAPEFDRAYAEGRVK